MREIDLGRWSDDECGAELLRRKSHRLFFFFNDTATTEIYTLSLHDALPICTAFGCTLQGRVEPAEVLRCMQALLDAGADRSEEHTSELQSRLHLVCRLLLEKKKIISSLTYSTNHRLLFTPIPLYSPMLPASP